MTDLKIAILTSFTGFSMLACLLLLGLYYYLQVVFIR